MTDKALLMAQARSYIGTRFAHQGRSKVTGVDCLGLLLCVAQDAGLKLRQQEVALYDRTDYGAFPDAQMLRQQLETALEPTQEMSVGDIVLLRIDGRPQHLALISDYPVEGAFGMIHAYAPMRKVVEHRMDEVWVQRIEQVFRIPSGLEDQRTT